eukprot:CAMPEP_0196579644 /NCGR_PEP_ID=MMETSP1081-20130531/23999_1 /TAXON_ID=36882 /ORGANISM="Pyramimonas amylifera, Strain CCMP720" /LENGTH=260 /DNA_ID=CAMNT_0041899289 /DNA_START=75 /DNA_END=853 /DNA_ORIENTATION=+
MPKKKNNGKKTSTQEPIPAETVAQNSTTFGLKGSFRNAEAIDSLLIQLHREEIQLEKHFTTCPNFTNLVETVLGVHPSAPQLALCQALVGGFHQTFPEFSQAVRDWSATRALLLQSESLVEVLSFLAPIADPSSAAAAEAAALLWSLHQERWAGSSQPLQAWLKSTLGENREMGRRAVVTMLGAMYPEGVAEPDSEQDVAKRLGTIMPSMQVNSTPTEADVRTQVQGSHEMEEFVQLVNQWTSDKLTDDVFFDVVTKYLP